MSCSLVASGLASILVKSRTTRAPCSFPSCGPRRSYSVARSLTRLPGPCTDAKPGLLMRSDCSKPSRRLSSYLDNDGQSAEPATSDRTASPGSLSYDAIGDGGAEQADLADPDHVRRKTSRLALDCVVKLHVKYVDVKYTSPWKKESQRGCSGTGFMYRDVESGSRLIITNQHVVEQATSVLAQRFGHPSKKPAKVVSVAHPLDLALLQVDDDGFWEGQPGLAFCPELPELEDNVTCVGFPVGGENISVTRGVVSRIDIRSTLVVNGVRLRYPLVPSVQIDAAINSGNSGGPVFDAAGDVVGVARATLTNASNVGYIIPVSVVQLYLSQYRRSQAAVFPGVASLGIPAMQALESPVLRERLKLSSATPGGVKVNQVDAMGPAAGLVEHDDVLLAVNGVRIAEDGTVPLRGHERISFRYLLHNIPLGSDLQLDLLRQGQPVSVAVKAAVDQRLVPLTDGWDCQPSYMVVGGLVLVPLTVPWLLDMFGSKSKGSKWPVVLEQCLDAQQDAPGQQVVVISKVLAHNLNFGYHGTMTGGVVRRFNGEAVHNLQGLYDRVREAEGPYLEFDIDTLYSENTICLSMEECREFEDDILDQHTIRFAADIDGQKYKSTHL